MQDSSSLSDTETKVNYLVRGMTDDELREMATLGLLLHVIHNDTMSRHARHTFDDVLRTIGPDFLLTFRALRMTARHIIAKHRNWRTRA